MTMNEFLITLEEELKYLPKKKRQVIINIYRDKINTEIDLGTDEEKITNLFPKPELIAADIYEKEGIDYLTRRKKKMKSDDAFKMIICSFVLLLTVSAIIVLTGYIGFSFYKLIYLVTLMTNVKDFIFILILVISLIVTILLIYLYLIDIFILIFNFLLDTILRPFNKQFKFYDFSIIDFIEGKLKKDKLFKKLLIGFFISTILIAITNYCLQTYFYRSYNQEVPTNINQVIDLSNYQTAESFKIDVDEADIYIKSGDKYEMKVVSEFNKNISLKYEDGILNVASDEIKTFDLFNFLKEPKPIYEITIPYDKKVSVVENDGIVQIENVKLEYLYVKLFQGNLILKNSIINESIIKSSNAGINFLDSEINMLQIESASGNINFENIVSTTFNVNNISTTMNVKNLVLKDFNLTSSKGDLFIDGINCNNINVEAGTGEIEINNVNCLNKIYMVSSSNANLTLGNANALITESTAINGNIVYHNVNAKTTIKTGATALINKCSGEYDVTCYGNFLTIQECKFTKAIINAQKTEVSFKFVQANYLEYNGNDSMSTLYFVFGKEMKINDLSGDLHFDNDQIIITTDEDRKLYNDYYLKIEKLSITPNASYRVEDGTKIGD